MTTQKEKTIEIKKNHLMIVEGQDEFRFFNAFLNIIIYQISKL